MRERKNETYMQKTDQIESTCTWDRGESMNVRGRAEEKIAL